MTSIGLIGAGRWGAHWLRTLAAMPDVELRWCCDNDRRVLDSVRKRYPGISLTTYLDDVLEDHTLKGIVIATPPETHFALARRALELGKHVLVEKPMTKRYEEAVELADLARTQSRLLLVGHLMDYQPAISKLEDMIASGSLGDIHYLSAQRLKLEGTRTRTNVWWSLAPNDIATACRLLDAAPVSIQCRGLGAPAEVVFATLGMSNGKLAHLHVSWIDPFATRKLTVVGSRRMAVVDDSRPVHKIAVHEKPHHPDRPFASYADWLTLPHGDVRMPYHEATEPLAVQAEHFVACIRGEEMPRADASWGAQVVSVLEHGQQSLDAGGKLIDMPMLPDPIRLSA